jgi:hypothetical protein
MNASAFSASEMMIVAAARELAGQRVCFVGVGLPNIAVNLAKRTVAPELELVYVLRWVGDRASPTSWPRRRHPEAGVFGARPARLPLSIGDPTIVTGATAVTSMFVEVVDAHVGDHDRRPGAQPALLAPDARRIGRSAQVARRGPEVDAFDE